MKAFIALALLILSFNATASSNKLIPYGTYVNGIESTKECPWYLLDIGRRFYLWNVCYGFGG